MTEHPTLTQSGDPIVYVREADPETLPDHLTNSPGKVFAIHDENGNRLALSPDRTIAFAYARKNDMLPVSVH